MQVLPNGGVQVFFSGAHIYSSQGLRLVGITQGFGAAPYYSFVPTNAQLDPNVSLSSLALGGGFQVMQQTLSANGLAASRYGTPCLAGSDTTMQISYAQLSTLSASISGVINLSPTFVQSCYNGSMPSLQGLAIDLYTSSSNRFRGNVYLCDSKTQSSDCAGSLVELQ